MIAIITGTRPDIIALSPVIRYCREKGMEHTVVHTGQHFAHPEDGEFFADLGLKAPGHSFGIGAGPAGEQTARALSGVEAFLMQEEPDVVVIYSGENTALAAGLAAVKTGVPVVCAGAGVREPDPLSAANINRRLTDSLARALCTATDEEQSTLLREGFVPGWIHQTGNPLVDAVRQNHAISVARGELLGKIGLEAGKYIVATVHQTRNIMEEARLKGIIEGVGAAGKELSLPVYFPLHPHTEEQLRSFGIIPEGIHFIKPVGYLEFLQLEGGAAVVMTDSERIEEESCILGVPCVTFRETTGVPETVAVGANALAGADARAIALRAKEMAGKEGWDVPFGDGKAGKRIAKIAAGFEGSG